MSRHSWIGLTVALAITGVVDTPAARAGYVTPDSIASPVISSSNYDATVAPNGLVTNQYQSLGILFPLQGPDQQSGFNSAAVIQLNNLDVFASAYQAPGGRGSVSAPRPMTQASPQTS